MPRPEEGRVILSQALGLSPDTASITFSNVICYYATKIHYHYRRIFVHYSREIGNVYTILQEIYSRNRTPNVIRIARVFTALHCMQRGLSYEHLSVRPSVRPSVGLSNAWIVTKRKHLAKKFSIMTNRKSPTSFQMSLRCTAYVATNPPKGAW